MSSDDEAEAWAKRYLDLWQDQMTALAGNPDLAKFFLAPMGALDSAKGADGSGFAASSLDPDLMTKWAQAWLEGFTSASETNAHDGATTADRPEAHEQGRARPTAPQRSSPVGSASELQRGELDALTKRLGELERRIDELESASSGKSGAKGGKRGAATPRKRTST